MKILLTGGAGFIGSTLLLTLPKEYEITVLDRGINQKLKNLIPKNITLEKGDITNKELVNKLVKNKDIVIHLAGGGGNEFCLNNPVDAINTNLKGTEILVNAAKENNVKQFIFSSSYIAYSTYKQRELPLKEQDELSPDEFYGAIKAFAENIVKKPPYLILRFSTVYGYGLGFGAQWTGVTGKFIKSALENKTIPVYGSGKQKIDLIHVNDLTNAINFLIKKQIINETLNIGSGKPISILKLAQTIEEVFKENNQEIEIQNLKAPAGKIFPDRYSSIEKIKNLGWKPKINLKQGIKEIIGKLKNEN